MVKQNVFTIKKNKSCNTMQFDLQKQRPMLRTAFFAGVSRLKLREVGCTCSRVNLDGCYATENSIFLIKGFLILFFFKSSFCHSEKIDDTFLESSISPEQISKLFYQEIKYYFSSHLNHRSYFLSQYLLGCNNWKLMKLVKTYRN